MNLTPLRFGNSLEEYERQACDLLDLWKAGDREAIELFKTSHPRFLDETIPWLPNRSIPDLDSVVRQADLGITDARLAVARWYSFASWDDLARWASLAASPESLEAQFEMAVEAVVEGDLSLLEPLLSKSPQLIAARSRIVTPHDPPVHGATLLHYTAANGVETFRQKTPPNAVEVAKVLLEAGAEVDSLAAMYGGRCTTMNMLVSSCHPAEAGVQVKLVETLLDYGAEPEGKGEGQWVSPLMTSLIFGYLDAAKTLVLRGARVDRLATAAGLGQLNECRQFIDRSSNDERHLALSLAASLGQVEAVRFLLDAGEDPNRFNPEGCHSHATPLHHAALAGHADVVRLLVERGARLDLRDKIYSSTPYGWAQHAGRTDIAEYLSQAGGGPQE